MIILDLNGARILICALDLHVLLDNITCLANRQTMIKKNDVGFNNWIHVIFLFNSSQNLRWKQQTTEKDWPNISWSAPSRIPCLDAHQQQWPIGFVQKPS